MQTFVRRVVGVMVALVFVTGAHADPVAELAAFSNLKGVDLAKLAGGEIVAMRGPTMNFPRGVSSEFCYVVMAPVQKTLDLHAHWSPAGNPELKTWLHEEIQGRPSLESFKKMASAPDDKPVRSLVEATQKLNPEQPQLQMSRAEAKLYSKTGAQGGAMLGDVSAFWSSLLLQRANAFVAGGLSGQPPYDAAGGTIRAADDVAQLFKETPKIHAQFSALADRLSGAQSNPQLYWELSDVEGTGVFSLGTFLTRQTGGGWQAVDAEYYNSGGYYVLLTFYQMWPVKIGDKDATLVWRGDLLSSATLGGLHGIERVAAGGTMTKDIKKTIGIFLKDVSTGR